MNKIISPLEEEKELKYEGRLREGGGGVCVGECFVSKHRFLRNTHYELSNRLHIAELKEKGEAEKNKQYAHKEGVNTKKRERKHFLYTHASL